MANLVPLLAALALTAAASEGSLTAADRSARFTQTAFAAAQAENRSILVETYAPWCLPCRVRGPVLARLLRQQRFDGIVMLRIDAKSPDADWKRIGTKEYGTLVAFKGRRRVAQGAPTDEAEIAAMLESALGR